MSLLTLNYNLPEKQNINQTDSSWTERRKNRKYMWNEKLQVGLCKNKSSRTDRRAPKKWYISEFTDAKRIAKWKKKNQNQNHFSPKKVKFVASKYNNVRLLLHNFLRQVSTRLTLILTRAGSIGLAARWLRHWLFFASVSPQSTERKEKHCHDFFSWYYV